MSAEIVTEMDNVLLKYLTLISARRSDLSEAEAKESAREVEHLKRRIYEAAKKYVVSYREGQI